jgi:hypothetical protein
MLMAVAACGCPAAVLAVAACVTCGDGGDCAACGDGHDIGDIRASSACSVTLQFSGELR